MVCEGYLRFITLNTSCESLEEKRHDSDGKLGSRHDHSVPQKMLCGMNEAEISEKA
jgi:hypothetical protein